MVAQAAAENHEQLIPALKKKIHDLVIPEIETKRGNIFENHENRDFASNRQGSRSRVFPYTRKRMRRTEIPVTQHYAIRVSKEPVFTLSGSDGEEVFPHDSRLSKYTKLDKNHHMWQLADQFELSPKLQKYCYVSIDKTNYHLVVINDLYTYTLLDFYNKLYVNFTPEIQEIVNTIVSEKIFNLCHKIVFRMRATNYDIKPLNTVIRFKNGNNKDVTKENIDLKFIDWDSDWCRETEHKDQEEMLFLWLMILFMNFHFVRYFHINIFNKYFNYYLDFLEENKDKMKTIFYDTTYPFKIIADHYFFSDSVRDKFLTKDNMKFDVLYDLCKSMPTILEKPQPPPPLMRISSPRSDEGFSLFAFNLNGGNNNKKNTLSKKRKLKKSKINRRKKSNNKKNKKKTLKGKPG